jgi:hypothetical protein
MTLKDAVLAGMIKICGNMFGFLLGCIQGIGFNYLDPGTQILYRLLRISS